MKTSNQKAFTLIELLTVIAIIGILAAIIIPTVGSVKVSANKAKTKVQFSQWAAGIGLFKQDYGYYPFFASGTTPPTNDTAYKLSNQTVNQLFFEILSGKKPDGSAITGNSLAQNKRRSSYYSFSDSELTSNGAVVSSINDAFNNTEIAVVIDYNYDGVIDSSAVTSTSVRSGNATEGYGTAYAPVASTIPNGGIRAGVVFYSAGKGSSDTDVVTSW